MYVQSINPKDFLASYQKEDVETWEIVDVREPWEHDLIRIPQAVFVPLSKMMENPQDFTENIDWNKKVLFVCRSGGRSNRAAEIFASDKLDVYNLTGGIKSLYHTQPNFVQVIQKDDLDEYFS